MKQPSNPYYSLPQPLTPNLPPTVVEERSPTSHDDNYNVGQQWVNTVNGTFWVLTQNSAGTVTWVQCAPSAGGLSTLTGNSGGAVMADGSNNINVFGDGSVITIAGVPATHTLTAAITGLVPVASGGTGSSTLTGILIGHGESPVTGQSVTQHASLVGGSSNGIVSVSPSATSGVPLVSQGAGSDPAFTTAVVAGGGTGGTSFTAYTVICGGTTTTNPLQNVSSVGAAGQVLTSNGAGMLPSFQALSAAFEVVRQVFTSSGTYTPTAGMFQCDITVIGGGGGGGGVAATAAGQAAGGGGGGSGGYAQGIFSSASIGVSQTVTIGAAGTAGGSGAGTGGTGGTSSVGVLITSTGGGGGTNASSPSTSSLVSGGNGGTGASGDFQTTGNPGNTGIGFNDSGSITGAVGGQGGSTFFGGGGASAHTVSSSSGGSAATSYGGGGGGAVSAVGSGSANGGVGFKGIVIILEYVSL